MKGQRIPCIHTTVGKRDEAVISSIRGKYSSSKFPKGHANDIAMDATLRAAAARLSAAKTKELKVDPQDVRVKIRRHRSPYVIVFVVDNSWSMHVETTLELTKGVVLELLKDAHVCHDKVAMVAFRHNRNPDATVCLPLTNSYALAAERLRKIPLSGTTPLPDGIRKAFRLLRQERGKYHNAVPVMVIITDGLPNIPIRRGEDPCDEIVLLCRNLRRDDVFTIVVDTEPSGSAAGPSNCRQMATVSGGKYLPLSKLTSRSIQEALSSSRVRESVKRVEKYSDLNDST
jgi:magnesium chelatase subunit D